MTTIDAAAAAANVLTMRSTDGHQSDVTALQTHTQVPDKTMTRAIDDADARLFR